MKVGSVSVGWRCRTNGRPKSIGTVRPGAGSMSSDYAGKFQGRTHTALYQDIDEMATPAAPPANMARTFVRDDGSGKTQLCVRFPTGDVQVIATEP